MDGAEISCPRCGDGNLPGTSRCRKCGANLRPLFLAIMISFGVLVGSVFFIVVLIKLATGALSPEWTLPEWLGFASFSLVLALFVGLWYGRYWAWVGIQIVWGFRVLLMLTRMVRAVINQVPLGRLGWPAVSAGVGVLLLVYVRKPYVRTFCSAGKPVKA